MGLGSPPLNFHRRPMSETISNFVSADNSSDLGRMNFVMSAAFSGLRTSMPVEVISVTNSGGVSAIGTVSVKPLVQGKDGSGNIVPHGIIYNVPYMRIQGGYNAVILDPQVGDIGLASVCDRDISTVQNSLQESPPGSSREFDMSDIVYIMTIISATVPTQYVQFNSIGITITSPNKVVINANEVDVNAATINSNGTWNHTGSITSTGDVIAGGKSLINHIHSGVSTGTSDTGKPV